MKGWHVFPGLFATSACAASGADPCDPAAIDSIRVVGEVIAGETVTFSVDPPATADSFVWRVPLGTSLQSGPGQRHPHRSGRRGRGGTCA